MPLMATNAFELGKLTLLMLTAYSLLHLCRCKVTVVN